MIISTISHQLGPYSYSSLHLNKEDVRHPEDTIIDNKGELSHTTKVTAEPKLLPHRSEGRGAILDIFV